MKTYSRPQLVRTGLVAALLALTAVVAPVMAHEYRVGDIEVIHPYAPPTPPGAPMAAGYLEIINHGTQDDRLVGGKVTFAHELQMHETTVEGDVSRMRQIEGGMLIPAGSTVKFEPLGKHLMFTDLAEPLVDGDRQSAVLTFEQAGDLEVEFAIEHAETGATDHENMDHGKMDHGDMNHGDMAKDGTMKKEASE